MSFAGPILDALRTGRGMRPEAQASRQRLKDTAKLRAEKIVSLNKGTVFNRRSAAIHPSFLLFFVFTQSLFALFIPERHSWSGCRVFGELSYLPFSLERLVLRTDRSPFGSVSDRAYSFLPISIIHHQSTHLRSNSSALIVLFQLIPSWQHQLSSSFLLRAWALSWATQPPFSSISYNISSILRHLRWPSFISFSRDLSTVSGEIDFAIKFHQFRFFETCYRRPS